MAIKVHKPQLGHIECLLKQTTSGQFDPDDIHEAFSEIWYEDDECIEISSFAERISRRVAGKHNKNAIFTLFGDTGSGKSMALLSLAHACSYWLASLLGGAPTDYFTMDNIAIIEPTTLKEKLSNLKKHNIYILDDAGPAYDARNFMSKSNKILNYVFQTCRTQNNIILVSAVHGKMVDITIHRIAEYYGEVAEQLHDEGVSKIKIFGINRRFRQGDIHYRFLTKHHVRMTRFLGRLPPKKMQAAYDTERELQAQRIGQMLDKEEEQEQKPKENRRDRDRRLWIEENGQRVMETIESNPDISDWKLGQMFGRSSQFINRVRTEVNAPKPQELTHTPRTCSQKQ